LASVSLFIEPITEGEKTKIGHMSFGHTHFFAMVNNGYLITAVGEVPSNAVQSIASAVRLKK
jgi:sigma-E factor negative regulatory protein RseB